MVNKVILIGNLGKDPEIRTLESGVTRALFTLATNEVYKDKNGEIQQNTEWHTVVLWRSLAERAKYLRKGMLVYVEGKLSHRKWTDKDGKDHYSTDIAAETVRILEKRENNSGNNQNYTNQSNKNSSNEGSFTPDVSSDDLPF
ncbi:MAG: single-stranded DNA-binding protein [Saprospiraceae bacterium]|jgi:single-strand DNA-binding protein|nr:single-stranded DNA-binding protein [Saprospiraceae bacterium]